MKLVYSKRRPMPAIEDHDLVPPLLYTLASFVQCHGCGGVSTKTIDNRIEASGYLIAFCDACGGNIKHTVRKYNDVGPTTHATLIKRALSVVGVADVELRDHPSAVTVTFTIYVKSAFNQYTVLTQVKAAVESMRPSGVIFDLVAFREEKIP